VVTVTLLDDLETVVKSSYECSIKRVLKQLSPKESAALTKLIDDPETSPTSLARVLTKNGFDISRQTIHRHRRRGQGPEGCKCP
jgi:t-SNARE complex subunit (syntaxin)